MIKALEMMVDPRKSWVNPTLSTHMFFVAPASMWPTLAPPWMNFACPKKGEWKGKTSWSLLYYAISIYIYMYT